MDYKKDKEDRLSQSLVEAGSNTSTVALRVVGGDEKGTQFPGGITGLPSSWVIKTRGPGPPAWGSLEYETVKCGHESRGTRSRECALARTCSNYKR
jgi:hypothetical protein